MLCTNRAAHYSVRTTNSPSFQSVLSHEVLLGSNLDRECRDRSRLIHRAPRRSGIAQQRAARLRPNARFGLFLEDGADRRKSSVHIGYMVDDIAAWREKLVAANVEILEATPIPHVERFYVRDPAGNRIEFMQRV